MKDHKRSGKGKFVWKNGAEYEGDFESDNFNGFGVYMYPKEDAKDYYEGHWKDDKMSGKGKFVWKNGAKYEGDFENGLRNGFGVFTFSKEDARDYYEGHWKDDKMSGEGKLFLKNGEKYDGNYENGKKMDLVFSPFQKKMQEPTIEVIGRTARDLEKENLSGKMEQNMRETLKMTKEMDLVF